MRIDALKTTTAYQSLKKDIDNNTLSHAYMVITSDNTARSLFFKLVAVAIMCPKGGCYECSQCKKVLERNHIDVKFVDAGDKITVKDINEIVEDTQTRSIEGGKKLYFIDNAENMSGVVQNKLLKTYEEPNNEIIIFLGVANESSILTTIKSRAKKLYISPFALEDIIKSLTDEGLDKQRAEVAASYAQGSIERAERMADEEGYEELFLSALEVLLSLKNSKQIVDFLFLTMFSKENISLTFDFLEIILSDVLILKSKAQVEKKIIHKDFDLQQIGKGFSPAGIATAIIGINEGRKRLQHNISATSVTEKVLFDILEAKYKWQ